MALIKCPECGNEISNTATQCPHCGFSMKKKTLINNYRKAIVGIITILVAVIIVLICKLYVNNKEGYPDIIGRIHLNMSQEDVEEILSSEINDLYYPDFGNEQGEVRIFICDSVDGKKLSQMQYSKEHPNVQSIEFKFDSKKKLKSIGLLVLGTEYEMVGEFGLGCKYGEMETFYEIMWKKKYCMVGKTRIEIGEHDDYANLGPCCSIEYKRLKDIEE